MAVTPLERLQRIQALHRGSVEHREKSREHHKMSVQLSFKMRELIEESDV